MSTRVLLADDHLVVRQGVRSLLEREGFDIVAEASDGHEAARLAGARRPDVAVLDLSMPLLNGLDAAREIIRVSPRTKPILLTMHAESRYVIGALQAGMRGYVLKTQTSSDLVHAIRDVLRGVVYLSPAIAENVVDAMLTKSGAPLDPLTPRERQVLQLVAEGKTTKEVSKLLDMRVRTAESHRTRIMEKLEIHHVAGLVHYALRAGLISL